jgi:hypothetical protein
MHRLQVVRLSENLHSWNVSADKMGGHFAALGDSYTLMSAEVKRFDTLGVGGALYLQRDFAIVFFCFAQLKLELGQEPNLVWGEVMPFPLSCDRLAVVAA